jgi:hypothetical protein
MPVLQIISPNRGRKRDTEKIHSGSGSRVLDPGGKKKATDTGHCSEVYKIIGSCVQKTVFRVQSAALAEVIIFLPERGFQ